MKIKTWQKIFICCFAVLFVAVFFVYDCLLLNPNKNFADEIIVDDLISDDVFEEENKSENIETEEDKIEQPELEVVPTYKNGYTCLIDAYNRLHNARSYKSIMVSKSYSAGVTQNVKCIKQKLDNIYSTENFAYTDSFLGRVFYSKTTTNNMKNFNYVYTENVNSDFSYDLNGAQEKEVDSLEEIQKLVGVNLFEVLVLTPSKDNGKLISFDKISNLDYYNITFAFNLKDIPHSIIDEMILHSGATSIEYLSCVIEVQISRKTGNIKRVTTKENYIMQVYGMKLDVQTISSALITNINEDFNINI